VSRERLLVDWGVADRVAATMIGGIGPLGAPSEAPDAPSPEGLHRVFAEGLALAEAYAGLGAVADPPAPQLIGRRAWATNAIDTLAAAASPIERRVAGDIGLPGPLASGARRALGAAAGAEAGIALGYAARRVIGQYDVALFGPERPARLLFVAENLASARRDLDADPDLFVRWIALHEATHVIQFERVEWLRQHLSGLAGELIGGAAASFEASGLSELGGRLIRDPRAFVRSALQGGLARTLATPAQRRLLDRLQATMSVIEGHAEHVMDAAAPELGPGLAPLRRRLDERRAGRGGVTDVLGRLLGFDLKLRQYALGKAFCDAIAREGGDGALRAVWRSPDGLPTLDELANPDRWMARVDGFSPLPA
jgi:coenzyme F420 biosynthesis associated uncharacterized protein